MLECIQGSYVIKTFNLPEQQHQMIGFEKSVLSISSLNNDSALMLCHYRLGHPNFLYLKKHFPSLFNKEPNVYRCEICQLAQQVCNSYPVKQYKSSKPFSMIHSDVWGASRIKNETGSR